MKKIAIFFASVLIILAGIYYIYLNNKVNFNTTKKANLEFENYLNQEIYGNDLATVINRAIDSNSKNNVEKNNKGIYIDNGTNSINVEIKFTDNNTIYQMETICNSGMQNFISYYNRIKFKCVDIKYHDSTNKVKYMLFEQITE